MFSWFGNIVGRIWKWSSHCNDYGSQIKAIFSRQIWFYSGNFTFTHLRMASTSRSYFPKRNCNTKRSTWHQTDVIKLNGDSRSTKNQSKSVSETLRPGMNKAFRSSEHVIILISGDIWHFNPMDGSSSITMIQNIKNSCISSNSHQRFYKTKLAESHLVHTINLLFTCFHKNQSQLITPKICNGLSSW